jgi:hypothetical protein
MKMGHISTKELSAFADGMARDPARVAAHVEHCAACGQRLAELRAMSAALHALPAPEPRPYFAVNVVARVEEMGTRSGWRRKRAVPAMAGLLVAAIVVMAVWLTPLLRGELPPEHVPAPVIAHDLRWHDDAEVVAALTAILSEGGETSLLEAGMVADEPAYEKDLAAQIMEGLLASAWPETGESMWPEESPALVDTMNFTGLHDGGPWLELLDEEG